MCESHNCALDMVSYKMHQLEIYSCEFSTGHIFFLAIIARFSSVNISAEQLALVHVRLVLWYFEVQMEFRIKAAIYLILVFIIVIVVIITIVRILLFL